MEAGAAPKLAAKPPTKIDTEHELLCTRNAGIDALSLNGVTVPVSLADEAAYAHYSIAAGSRAIAPSWCFRPACSTAPPART